MSFRRGRRDRAPIAVLAVLVGLILLLLSVGTPAAALSAPGSAPVRILPPFHLVGRSGVPFYDYAACGGVRSEHRPFFVASNGTIRASASGHASICPASPNAYSYAELFWFNTFADIAVPVTSTSAQIGAHWNIDGLASLLGSLSGCSPVRVAGGGCGIYASYDFSIHARVFGWNGSVFRPTSGDPNFQGVADSGVSCSAQGCSTSALGSFGVRSIVDHETTWVSAHGLRPGHSVRLELSFGLGLFVEVSIWGTVLAHGLGASASLSFDGPGQGAALSWIEVR